MSFLIWEVYVNPESGRFKLAVTTQSAFFYYLSVYVSPQVCSTFSRQRCPRDVMVKLMDSRIVVSKSELQSHYYIHLWTNTLGKGMNPLILPAMGWIVALMFF